MSCSHPLYAITTGALSKNGKKSIRVLPKVEQDSYFDLVNRYGVDHVLMLPCGKCAACIEDRSKSWALRCVLESSLYLDNCFLTLTYNDKCLPNGLCKKDVQNFFKKLRKRHPELIIRYFGCGEYGEHTKRPHYHFIVFNYFPKDAVYSCKAKFGGFFYTSKELQECWPFGFVSVGECSFASCAYVARYCMKKAGVNPGFSMMSLKPGIGAKYFEEHKDFIYKYDKVFGDFGDFKQVKPSRYFDKLFERFDADAFQALKLERITRANSYQITQLIDHQLSHLEDLLTYNGKIKEAKMSRLKRKDL